MIWFVISIILLLFSAAVTGVALSRDVKGAGIGLIPGLVGLLLLIPACLYSVDVGEVAVIRNMGGSLAGHSEDAGFHWKTPWQSVIKYDTRNNLINFYKDTDYKYDGGSAVGKQVSVQDVRYGEAITKKYTEAQAAEIDKQKALNEQQVAKTEAETKKIKAQGEADANAVLNESLTDNVLKQHYIDALSNADQLVVVPDGADTLVQTK